MGGRLPALRVPGLAPGPAVTLVCLIVAACPDASAQDSGRSARVTPLPCRLVATGTLRRAVEEGLKRSETLRRQCDEIAAARAVVSLEWGQPTAQWHARTRMGTDNGVVVASAAIPPVDEAIGVVAHELHHVIERIRRVDFEAESRRSGSGVRRTEGGYETQGAIDAGRQVWREVQESREREIAGSRDR